MDEHCMACYGSNVAEAQEVYFGYSIVVRYGKAVVGEGL